MKHDAIDYATEHIPNARVRDLPDAGHGALFVQPDLVASEIVSFADEICPQDA